MAAAKAPCLEAAAQVLGRLREALGSILVPDWALWRLGETSEVRRGW